MHFSQFQQQTPLPFQPTILEEGQKSARTAQFYDRIDNLLKQSSEETLCVQSQTKIKILQQLQMFHEFYKQRHEQLKDNYEKLNKVNWQYANQILQYERKIQITQKNYKDSNEKLQKAEEQLKEVKENKVKMEQMYSERLNEKETELMEMKKNIQTEFTLNQIKKKKILRVRENKQNVEKQQVLEKVENTKIMRQYLALKQNNDELVFENEELIKQNELIRKKLKHLQADRKYEDQRLKNATLALQLDLKLKVKQIERLVSQIDIYQKKFEEALIASSSSNSVKHKLPLDSENDSGYPSCNLNSHINSNINSNINSQNNTNNHTQANEKSQLSRQKKKFYKMFQNYKYEERTHKRLDMPNSARGHKRHGSANLDENNIKDDLDMKIKIIRYDKSKKKI